MGMFNGSDFVCQNVAEWQAEKAKYPNVVIYKDGHYSRFKNSDGVFCAIDQKMVP